MKKRFLTLALAFVLLLAILPVGASAEEYAAWNPEYFGWNIASSITERGSANRFEDEDAYNAIAACVNVYVGQVAADATLEDIDAAVEAGTLVEMPIGGFSRPRLSDYTINRINQTGLVVVARNGLTFTKSSICCNDEYGFNCQTAAAGNAGDFNDAIESGSTKILIITPEMLAEDDVYHRGRGNAWLMLSIGGTAEFNIIYNTRTGTEGDFAMNKVETLAVGSEIPAYTPEAPAGHVFSGWYEDADLTTAWEKPAAMPSNDIVVYGQFVPRTDLTYTVHYLIKDTGIPVAEPKVVTDQTYGTVVTEEAITVNDFVAEAPTTQELTLTEDNLEIIFYYTLKAPEIELNKEDHFNYIIGYPDGTVRPENNISRAEAATIFFRLMTEESRNEKLSHENNFSDVSSKNWHNTAVSTLANAGILNGYPDGTFRPDQPITRGEMAKIIALFAELKEGTVSFNDINRHWAKAYIRLAAGNGWINGYPDGTFCPDKPITRAETAAMINRVLGRDPKSEASLHADMIRWTDNTPDKWYYLDIQEATNYHSSTRGTPNILGELWVELLPNIDWTQYHY